MGAVFLVLAQAPGGLTCFVVERGEGFELQRLKDKLGTRSLASSEVEFRDAPARRLGEEGRGVATIIEMVTHTRLDCVIGSAATMRRGVAEAVHHARHRRAFGARLAEQPLMVNVLADLAIESEAATASALRLARAYDEDDRAFRRFATAVMKYWICKRATPHAAEALECLGGNGYVEESPMPRLLRDAPLNGIWEGSGNVISLDVLRALAREPEGLPAFLAECELGRGGDARLDAHLDALPAALGRARRGGGAVARPAGGRGPRAGLPGVAARPVRAARGGRRVLRRAARRRARARLRDAAARRRRRRDRRPRPGHVKFVTSAEARRAGGRPDWATPSLPTQHMEVLTMQRLIVKALAAILAIGLITAATAGAASLITGADIQNGTVTGKDIKQGGVKLSDLSDKAKASLAACPVLPARRPGRPAGARRPAGRARQRRPLRRGPRRRACSPTTSTRTSRTT